MSRRETPLRAARILEALAEHEVDCVIIGGLAVQAHGHTRTTQDVDVVPEPASENFDRLARALRELGAADESLDGKAIARADVLSLDSDAGGIDVHLSPPGAAPYADLRRRAMEVEVAGVRVAIAGKDDLIAMKRAAGRPLDRGDVIALTTGDAG